MNTASTMTANLQRAPKIWIVVWLFFLIAFLEKLEQAIEIGEHFYKLGDIPAGIPENVGNSLKEMIESDLKSENEAIKTYQEIIEVDPQTLRFQMVDCRVQSTRKRKGLPDFPCKSVGIVEYEGFAEAIDPHIKTKCIACPPDPHPDDFWCAWEFTLAEE